MNKQNLQTIGIIIFFLLIAGAVFYFVKNELSGLKPDSIVNEEKNETDNKKNAPKISILSKDGTEEGYGVNEIGLPAQREGYKMFRHADRNFSFEYPENLTIGKFSEGGGEIVLAQRAGEKFGFQIFVNPFDEAGPLTRERILKDVRDMAIEGEKEIILDSRVKALAFYGDSQSFGRTYEVWFIHDEYLYQITAYAELDKWLGEILESWKF